MSNDKLKQELLKLLNESQELEKGSLKGALAGAAMLAGSAFGAPPSTPKLQTPHVTQAKPAAPEWLKTNSPNETATFDAEPIFKPEGVHDHLKAIATNESQFGTMMDHAKQGTDWNTAHGAFGIKPMSVFDTFKNNRRLQTQFSDINSKDSFIQKFKTDPDFHNEMAKTLWNNNQNDLVNSGINPSHINQASAYAWRYGINKAKQDYLNNPESVLTNPYVQKYQQALKAKDWLKKKPQQPGMSPQLKQAFDSVPGMKPDLREAFESIAGKLSLPYVQKNEDEFGEELEKVSPGPKFAGLLGTPYSPKGDDRRDTPIIGPSTPIGTKMDDIKTLDQFPKPQESDYRAFNNKRALIDAAVSADKKRVAAEKAAKLTVSPVRETNKPPAIAPVTFSEKQAPTPKKRTYRAGSRIPTTGYALNENMRADRILSTGVKPENPKVVETLKDPNEPIGTKLHEDSHAMEARLMGKKDLKLNFKKINNIYGTILQHAYKDVENGDEVKNAMNESMKASGYNRGAHNEHYAKILNLMNSPTSREQLKRYLPAFQPPKTPVAPEVLKDLENQHYRKYYTAIKKVYHRFNRMANAVKPEHVEAFSLPTDFNLEEQNPPHPEEQFTPQVNRKADEFDKDQIKTGTKIEAKEHHNLHPKMLSAKDIVEDHLEEDSRYYDHYKTEEFDGWEHLEKVEEDGE